MVAAVFGSGSTDHLFLFTIFLVLYLAPGGDRLDSLRGLDPRDGVSFRVVGSILSRLYPDMYRSFKEDGGTVVGLLLPWKHDSPETGTFRIFRLARGQSAGDGTVHLACSLAPIRDAWMHYMGLEDIAADDAYGIIHDDLGYGQDQEENYHQGGRYQWWESKTKVHLLLLHLLGPYVRGAGEDDMEWRVRREEARLVRFLLVGGRGVGNNAKQGGH
jgi:hypothetical protein